MRYVFAPGRDVIVGYGPGCDIPLERLGNAAHHRRHPARMWCCGSPEPSGWPSTGAPTASSSTAHGCRRSRSTTVRRSPSAIRSAVRGWFSRSAPSRSARTTSRSTAWPRRGPAYPPPFSPPHRRPRPAAPAVPAVPAPAARRPPSAAQRRPAERPQPAVPTQAGHRADADSPAPAARSRAPHPTRPVGTGAAAPVPPPTPAAPPAQPPASRPPAAARRRG